MQQSSRAPILTSFVTFVNVTISIILIVIVWRVINLSQSQVALSQSQLDQIQANMVWTTTLSYMDKWQAIMNDRDLVIKQKLTCDEYWQRYWLFQQEQYFLWKNGIINADLYKIWMNFRRNEWERNELLSGISYRDAYQAVAKTGLLMRDFQDHMKEVFSATTSPLSEQ